MTIEFPQIINRLCDHNFSTFIVGGAVRDLLLGVQLNDVDIATSARPEQIKNIFHDCRVSEVGKSFGVVLVDGIEIASFRGDNYTGLSSRACEISYVDRIEDDLSRRDLTINAMALCEASGNIIDPFNGIGDLKKRIIRFVGDPVQRIFEDPNRIIRACRFLASIDGEFAPETFLALRAHSSFVRDHVAVERIRIEVLKAMKLPLASPFFQALHDIGALVHIFPGMASSCHHPHGQHHLETVFDHLMLVGDSLSSRDPVLRLSGYLHDIGKPQAYAPEDETFFGHEINGSATLAKELRHLSFSKDEISRICGLVRCHMRPVKGLSPKGLRRLRKKLIDHHHSVEDFLRLRIADRKGNLAKEPFSIKDIKSQILLLNSGEMKNSSCRICDLAISGRDILKIHGVQEGPEVGRILKKLLDFVIEHGEEVNSREQLLEQIN